MRKQAFCICILYVLCLLKACFLSAQPCLWECSLNDFSEAAYEEALSQLLSAFEAKIGHPLRPGKTGKVALKVSTAGGEGLSTPVSLVKALIKHLERRGYLESSIIIFDLSQRRLKDAAYSHLLEGGSAWGQVKICDISAPQFRDDQWFYESPLPPLLPVMPMGNSWKEAMLCIQESRKSYLPVALFFDVDFWINLPVGMDNEILGVSAAMANATLYNITNGARFLRSPSLGPIAVAEIGAIPELKSSLAFTILSLERYQFVGGSTFNALYTVSEKRLWLSEDPVWMDFLLLKRINYCRKHRGFSPYQPLPSVFDKAKSIGVGDYASGYVHIL